MSTNLQPAAISRPYLRLVQAVIGCGRGVVPNRRISDIEGKSERGLIAGIFPASAPKPIDHESDRHLVSADAALCICGSAANDLARIDAFVEQLIKYFASIGLVSVRVGMVRIDAPESAVGALS